MDQLPDGGVANVVPNIEETHTEANWLMKNCPYGASGWGDAATVIPWVLYQMYGDDTILRSQYPSMKRWVDFMRANTQNGLFDFKMQLGDWVALDAEPGSYFGATPTALTSQAYYALSAQLLELAAEYPDVEVEVVPGLTAALSGAAVLGAPLAHDFCVISLSDRLTPWEMIEKRLACAAMGDFCVALYNPSSKGRPDYLQKAVRILLQNGKGAGTLCGVIRSIGRTGQQSSQMTLAELEHTTVDMFTTVFIGNLSLIHI